MNLSRWIYAALAVGPKLTLRMALVYYGAIPLLFMLLGFGAFMVVVTVLEPARRLVLDLIR